MSGSGNPSHRRRCVFPDHVFKGTSVRSRPVPGAIRDPAAAERHRQFRQVVQRVPVRIYFDSNDKYVRS